GGLRALGGELRPGPALSIQGRIGPQRRWAAGRAPLADAKAARRRFEVTVNDVVLAAITAAFRDILIDRGDDVGRALLRAAVPVSV
ncbi:wax ester/triacylglycerol synthase domain-containing protein, partial [Pseudomonas sp. AH2 (2023)]|uniref:wax ester/triacylglycerol synthase domain-containing protein n=1 Tax=Pseudomonas sp. AH2 (2023) TaxID=3048599 RepID=UPI002B235BDF